MKILVLNYEYPPIGGESGIVTKNMCEQLLKNGHEITVLTTWFKGEEENFQKNNFRIFRLKSKRKSIEISNPKEMLLWIHFAKNFLKKHLITENYNFCIANFALPCGEVAYEMNLTYKLPYVIISHAYDIPWNFPKQMMWYHALTYQWIRKICLSSKRNYIQTETEKNNIDNFLGDKFFAKNKIIKNGEILEYEMDFLKLF
ncbi:MAG: glycosyltransferase [Bacteroidales bacterium]|jgi:glycosyltransferase involved in cell wall biosynthesis|nr:glycosyltransferase [Bacteroidales bacterium]